MVLMLQNIYYKMVSKAKTFIDNKNSKVYFIILFKQLLLESGLSINKFYDECVRKVAINMSFMSFCECFKNLINLEPAYYSFFKYKCKKLNNIGILYLYVSFKFSINNPSDVILLDEDVDEYFSLIIHVVSHKLLFIKLKVKDSNFIELQNKLKSRFNNMFGKNIKLYHIRYLIITMESFFKS